MSLAKSLAINNTRSKNAVVAQLKKELVTINRNRGATYLFLSKAYEIEVSTEQIEAMKKNNGPMLDVQALQDVDNTDLRDGADLLTRSLSRLKGKKTEDARIELAADFAGTFLGVKHDLLPHPSESAYLTEEHLVFQRQRNEVFEMYKQVGLDKAAAFTEPEDHIAVELSFMSHLTEETAKALEADNMEDARRFAELQRRFLKEHLLRWAPKMCDDVLLASETDFYKGIARITKGFLNVDLTTTDSMIDELKAKG